jgi:ribosome biogenesis protein MAK21
MNGDIPLNLGEDKKENKTKHIIPKDSIELLHEAQAKKKHEEESSKNEENSEKEINKEPQFSEEFLSSMDWTKVGKLPMTSYDPIKREPRFVNSEASCFFELCALGQHIHPSVAKFANYLLAGEDVQYEGDPITDFSLTSFLDRFSYKKPKKEPKVGSGSAMQPTHIRRVDIEHPVNSQEFLNQKEHEISEQDVFFYKYFKMKEHADPEASNKKKQKKKRDEEESDAEDVEGEEEVEEEDNEVEGAEADDIGSFEEVDDDEADAFLKNQMGVLEEAGDEDIADLEDNGDSFEGDFDYDDLDNASFDEDSDEIADPSDKHLEKVLKDEYSDDEGDTNGDMMEGDDELDDEDEDGLMGELLEDDLDAGDDDDDDDDEDDEEEEQMSNRQRKKLQQRGGIKLKTGSTFASADEFADLLLNNDSNTKQSAWEEGNWRKKSNFSGQKRKAGGGSSGKKGAGGRKGGNKRQRRG